MPRDNKAYRREWRSRPGNKEREAERRRERWNENREARLAAQRAYRAANPEVVRRLRKADYEKHHEKHLERSRRCYRADAENNAEANRERARKWGSNNPDRVRARCAAWARENPERVSATIGKRRARKFNATPAWAEHEVIELIYAEAKHRQLQVDHIIPLQGKTVCGLHVETNLQLLTLSENVMKRNKYPYQSRIPV